jgi:hypothetical protein
VFDETKLVDIQLGGDNLEALEPIVASLLHGLPDSELVEAPDKRAFRSGA